MTLAVLALILGSLAAVALAYVIAWYVRDVREDAAVRSRDGRRSVPG